MDFLYRLQVGSEDELARIRALAHEAFINFGSLSSAPKNIEDWNKFHNVYEAALPGIVGVEKMTQAEIFQAMRAVFEKQESIWAVMMLNLLVELGAHNQTWKDGVFDTKKGQQDLMQAMFMA